ncbi:MAG: Nucleoside-diphosphate sugar epimerase [Frankiales bacterium]|nr:Nucleoside-diphosphate sugar epimerase [Frankiales bacterium]
MGLIGVTGATGRVGGLVAAALKDRGVEQRLLVRDPSKVTGFDDVVRSSYDEPAGLDGVATLLMVSAAEHPDRVGQHLRFLDAVAAAGVERVVYTSFLGAAPDSTFTLARHHWATERKLRELGIAFVALRDSLYADFLPFMKAADGVVRGPAGDGEFAPVAITDVADAAVAALLDPSLVGSFDLTGPRLVTFAEAAAFVGATFVDETVEEAWASRRGLAEDWELEGWITSYLGVRSGELAFVSDGVRQLTGREPTSLEDLFAR